VDPTSRRSEFDRLKAPAKAMRIAATILSSVVNPGSRAR